MGAQLMLFPERRKRRDGKVRAKPGRKVREDRVGFLRHRTRPVHDANHPVHVTIRRVRLAPSFRTERLRTVILGELSHARGKGVRVIEYSIQDDHLHLMVEGRDAADLSAQMRKLFSRIAMSINAAVGRRGSLFRDRHHRHELSSPREVRNARVYILLNGRKHARGADARTQQEAWATPDAFSSAPWFGGWAEHARPPPDTIAAAQPASISRARTWLARVGWKRGGGPIRFDESPRSPR
jgi:REP element-mobilizing transposase RayT